MKQRRPQFTPPTVLAPRGVQYSDSLLERAQKANSVHVSDNESDSDNDKNSEDFIRNLKASILKATMLGYYSTDGDSAARTGTSTQGSSSIHTDSVDLIDCDGDVNMTIDSPSSESHADMAKTGTPTHPLPTHYPPTHSLTHSLTYSLTHSLTQSLTHSLSHSVTLSLSLTLS